jgi:hypothetical protein
MLRTTVEIGMHKLRVPLQEARTVNPVEEHVLRERALLELTFHFPLSYEACNK